jgi:hypothetical protein
LILLLPILLLLQAVPNLVKSFEILRKGPNDGVAI